jgi:hypothetical protein
MVLNVVVFTIGADIPPDSQDTVVDGVRTVDGVADAFLLAPDSPSPDIQRMGAVAVADGADPGEVVARVQAVPGVESANLPPERGPV